MEYEFTLKLSIADADADELIERLGAAGCTDALAGIGQPGRLALAFTRDADSARQAMVSAIEEVKAVLPETKLLEVTPDFVGLTDIADVFEVSRQNLRKLRLSHLLSFPLPVHEGSSSVWHLFPVLNWLREKTSYTVPDSLLDVAHMAMQINLAKESKQIEHSMHEEVRELFA
jgi:hypothetical protein